jgi:ribA/ribD-fused uncharacterized protein
MFTKNKIYEKKECIAFQKNKEAFGELSNMAKFPLKINNITIRTSEALYQACRFPNLPNIQGLIIEQVSPMYAKRIARKYGNQSRNDWYEVRVKVMKWCLHVKLAQHWETFGKVLLSTKALPIVEKSQRDDFWGAIPQDNETFIGKNVLGCLLMELREELHNRKHTDLKIVKPLDIDNFCLYGKPIETIYSIDGESKNKTTVASKPITTNIFVSEKEREVIEETTSIDEKQFTQKTAISNNLVNKEATLIESAILETALVKDISDTIKATALATELEVTKTAFSDINERVSLTELKADLSVTKVTQIGIASVETKLPISEKVQPANENITFEASISKHKYQQFEAKCNQEGKTLEQGLEELIDQALKIQLDVNRKSASKPKNKKKQEKTPKSIIPGLENLFIVQESSEVLANQLANQEKRNYLSSCLTDVELANKFGVSRETIRRNKARGSDFFKKWSACQDPEGIVWEYSEATKLYEPELEF